MEFEIIDSFYITQLGFVVLGKVLTGEINKGDSITFVAGDHSHHLKVNEINFARMPNKAEELIGLSFIYENAEQKEYFDNIKPLPQIAQIVSK